MSKQVLLRKWLVLGMGGVLLLALAVLLGTGVWTMVGDDAGPPTVSADDDGFTNESIEGAWGFSASGTVLPPALPAATPVAAVGIMTFDGDGGCSITDQINIGGAAVPPVGFRTSTTCSYAVNSDGTGTISVLFSGDPGPIPLTFVIVDDAEEIRFIRTDLGVASGVAKRQNDDD